MRIINFPLIERFHYSDFMVTIILNVFYGEVNKVHLYIYIYITEAFEAPTIFHVSIIFKLN